MSAVRVRPASINDADRIAELATELGYPATAEEVRDRLGTLLNTARHAVFVAESGRGEVDGWIHVTLRELITSDRFAEIAGLIVDGNHRGGGIGRALVAEAERWAASVGCATTRVRSNVIRDRAARFYQGLGYTQLKSQNVFGRCLETPT